MKGSTGLFFVGVLVGVVGSLLAIKLRKEGLPEGVDNLADRIQDNLDELESRIQAVVAAE